MVLSKEVTTEYGQYYVNVNVPMDVIEIWNTPNVGDVLYEKSISEYGSGRNIVETVKRVVRDYEAKFRMAKMFNEWDGIIN